MTKTHPPPYTNKPTLLTLPRELQLQVTECLGLKTDLKNLCLVSKKMRDVATPMLYKDMVIHVDKLDNDFQQAIAAKDHRGLPHVRTLLVVDTGWEERMWSYTHAVLLKLLSALPRDKLTHFQLPNFSVLDHTLDRLLRDRQRKLASYQYQSPERTFGSSTSVLPSGDGFSCITTLSLCIWNLDDCRQGASILKHSPRVTSLAITMSRQSFSLADGSLALGIICSAAHKYRGPLGLTALRFERILLAGVGPVLQDHVVLEALQNFQLLQCHDVDSFLQGLSHKCSRLRSFAIEHCEDIRDIDTINEFLKATTLRRLVLRNRSEDSSDAQGLVSFDTLASLARALECLVLDNSSPRHTGSGPESRPGSLTDLEGLCKSLQSLQQLCIMSPAIDRKQWLSFLTFLNHLRHLHNLRALKLVFPELWYRQYYPDQAYHEAADEIFDILSPHCSQLTTVVLLARSDTRSSAWYFVRPRKTGRRAHVKLLGVNVMPYVIKEYEPCSDMLEPEKMVFG